MRNEEPEMTASDVIEFVQLLNQNHIGVYIDGGWGVDALLGEQTRRHADLDIAVQHQDVPRIRALLEARGYKDVPRDDTRDCNFVLGDDRGRQIDVHSYTFDAAGNLVFGVPYPFDSLNGTGSVDGYPVKCISPEWMVKFHTGYELDENDYHDVRLLCWRFGLEMPAEYGEFEREDALRHVPEQKRLLLQKLVDQLSDTPGVAAIVLGGSYVSGTHHDTSDLDVGLYYFETGPFSIAAIQQIADGVSVKGPAAVTGFYEWGAWVNGGAWIHTPQGKVDFLYRNLDQIQRAIVEARQGICHHDYDQQPTYGFYSVIYLAETQICIPLYDPDGLIAKLKRQVATYPPRLKQRVIADSLWAAEFTLMHAREFAAQGDVYNTVGCLTRTVSNMTQALFALNEQYFIRDKKVMDAMAGFPNLPRGYTQQVNRILACPGRTARELAKAVGDLEQAWLSVVSLDGVHYEPKFRA
jgi:hypothetical protein